MVSNWLSIFIDLSSSSTELGESTAVNRLIHDSCVYQIVHFLQNVDSEHQFQIVELIALFLFVIAHRYLLVHACIV